MPRNTIRALCALITMELDPKKVDILIEELTTILLGDHIRVQSELVRDGDRELRVPKGGSSA